MERKTRLNNSISVKPHWSRNFVLVEENLNRVNIPKASLHSSLSRNSLHRRNQRSGKRFLFMKNHRGKRRSKESKTSPRHSDEGIGEVDDALAKERMASDKGQIKKSVLTFYTEHYSLYERTGRIEERRKLREHFYVTEKNRRANTKRETKGQSLLPQLKESKHNYSTFMGGNRAGGHLLNGSFASDQNRRETLRPTCFGNRSSKKFASVSFVGAYDLADMRRQNKTARKQKPNIESVLTSNNCGEETMRDVESTVTFWVPTKQSDEKKSEKCFREFGAGKATYAVKNLTLEWSGFSSKRIEAHKNVCLPGIDKKSYPKKCYRKPHEEGAKQDKLSRKLENGTRATRMWSKLPKINGNQSKQTRTSRGKRRKHDMAYEAVYLDKNLLRLPLLKTNRTSDFFDSNGPPSLNYRL